MIVYEHLTGNTVWSHGNIIHCQEVLWSISGQEMGGVYFYGATRIRGIFVVICIDVVFSPTLSVGGTVDARYFGSCIAWESHCHHAEYKQKNAANAPHIFLKHVKKSIVLLSRL